MSRWHETATNRRSGARRIAFWMARHAMRATSRSTTEVNSSNTQNGISSSARARSTRIFSPFERTEYGLSHEGTLPKPTAQNIRSM